MKLGGRAPLSSAGLAGLTRAQEGEGWDRITTRGACLAKHRREADEVLYHVSRLGQQRGGAAI